MTDYALILSNSYPGKEWSLNGDSYEGLVWLSEGEKPSKAELDAAWQAYVAEQERTEYQRLRAPEYPPLTDLADAIYWQQQGDETKMAAYVAACEAVKAKYPKPE